MRLAKLPTSRRDGVALQLPVATASALLRVAGRLNGRPSQVAERLLDVYLEALDDGLDDDGVATWLDRLFVARYEAPFSVDVTLELPAWQRLALARHADTYGVDPSVVFVAMLSHALAVACGVELDHGPWLAAV